MMNTDWAEFVMHKHLAEMIGSLKFVESKDREKDPHEYALLNSNNKDNFNDCVTLIRSRGKALARSSDYWIGYNINGFCYSVTPNVKTQVIRKDRKHHPSIFCSLGQAYITAMSSDYFRGVIKSFCNQVEKQASGRVLEINPRFGATLSEIGIKGLEAYEAVEDSYFFYKAFRRKNTGVKITYSRLLDFGGYGYDTILAMWGAASHFGQEEVNRITNLLKPGGKAFMMFHTAGFESIEESIGLNETELNKLPGTEGISRCGFTLVKTKSNG